MMMHQSVKLYRTCGQYEPRPSQIRQTNGMWPHEAWRSKSGFGHKHGLMIARRKEIIKDWSLGCSAITRTLDAEEAHEIEKGYLIMENPDKTVMRVYTIKEVVRRLTGFDPNPGTEYGNFYFVDVDLNVKEPGNYKQNMDLF